jgi:hypothetical protein
VTPPRASRPLRYAPPAPRSTDQRAGLRATSQEATVMAANNPAVLAHVAQLLANYEASFKIFGMADDSTADLKQIAIVLRVRSLCCALRDWGAFEMSQLYQRRMSEIGGGLNSTTPYLNLRLVEPLRAKKMYPQAWLNAAERCPPPGLLRSAAASVPTGVRCLQLLLSDRDDKNADFFNALSTSLPLLEELCIVRSHTISTAVVCAISDALLGLPNLRLLKLVKIGTRDKPRLLLGLDLLLGLRSFIAENHPRVEVKAYALAHHQ